jgi:hypothetical protein
MKRNENASRKPISLGSLRVSEHTMRVEQTLAAAARSSDPALLVISPKEALGQLIQLEVYARKYFGQLIGLNWSQQLATQVVSAETVQVLRSVLDVRTFDAQHLALSPRNPLALLECFVDNSGIDQVEIQPSARGLALVEALLTGEDVSY